MLLLKAAWRIPFLVVLVAASTGCTSAGPSMEEAEALRSRIVETEDDRDQKAAQIDELTAQLNRALEDIVALESESSSVEEERRGTADRADAMATELADTQRRLQQAERDLRDATGEVAKLDGLLSNLSLAYDSEIKDALGVVRAAASEFSCEYGDAQAEAGEAISGINSAVVANAFRSSDGYRQLISNDSIAAAIDVAEVLEVDAFGATPGALEAIARDCWQRQDAQQNAALYQHQELIRSAVFDAACTLGASEVFDDRFTHSGGYKSTAVYQDWALRIGWDEADDYLEDVRSRFGSISDFVGVSADDLDGESDRCDAVRDLVAPKGGGTWNVGEEIQPGTWTAFDESDCYWARLAVNGDIRDNHFGDGLRLTANVRPSDGQFEISGCTFYYANP